MLEDGLVELQEERQAGVKERFSSFATKYLRKKAASESDPTRRIQIETAEIIYGHFASSIPTHASALGTAVEMGIVEDRKPSKERKSLDQLMSHLINRSDIEVLNIGDPYLMTADKRVTVLDPVILEKKPEGAKVVKGVFPPGPFKSESFDAIFCKNSIGYPMAEMDTSHVTVIMKEFLRLIKREGMIFINAIEFDRNDENEWYFSAIRDALDDLRGKGIIEYDYDQEIDEAEAVGSTPPAATTWYTLRIRKVSDYCPEAFPGDIMAEVATAYNEKI